MADTSLPLPFSYYGGKRRWAACIWQHFGAVDAYYEPFFGTGAVLFGAPPHKRELVCDLNGLLCNFWRERGVKIPFDMGTNQC